MKPQRTPDMAISSANCRPVAPAADRRMLLLEGQARVLEAVARGANLEIGLTCLAGLAAEIFSDAGCGIFVRDAQGSRLELGASAELPADYAEGCRQLAKHARKEPSAAAVLRGEPVIVSDLVDDLLWSELQALAAPFGLRAVWAHPVLDAAGETVGAMTLYFPHARSPSDGDYQLIDALIVLARLIIEHDRRSKALRSADERFLSLAASIPGVVYQRVVTPDGDIRYTYISEGARELFGVSPEEVIANPKALFECHGPEYRKDFRDRLLAASRDLTMWDVEAEIITRSGERKWTHAIARPLRQADGTVVWNGVVLDATRLKLVNLELAAANRAKSQFLANMSHELRTPLNAIIGFSSFMATQALGPLGSERYLDYARDITSSGEHLLGIINDILDLSKIETQGLELDEEIVNLSETIDACLRVIRGKADEGEIELSVRLEKGIGALRADPRKLKQILGNLLSNAVKFTPPGGKVEVAVWIDGSGDLLLTVSDNGPGIPEDLRQEVVNPFFQIDRGLNRKHEGTGLGLALTKAMTELHGGSFQLGGQCGEGTVATVRLPAERVSRLDASTALIA